MPEQKVPLAPLPWGQAHRANEDGYYNTQVFDARGSAIANMLWLEHRWPDGTIATSRATNAEYIVTACNSYPALVAALQAHDAYMSEQFSDGPNSKALNPRAAENWRRVRAALREAGITEEEK